MQTVNQSIWAIFGSLLLASCIASPGTSGMPVESEEEVDMAMMDDSQARGPSVTSVDTLELDIERHALPRSVAGSFAVPDNSQDRLAHAAGGNRGDACMALALPRPRLASNEPADPFRSSMWPFA